MERAKAICIFPTWGKECPVQKQEAVETGAKADKDESVTP